MYKNLAVAGGGITGLAYIGMLSELENTGTLDSIENLTGSSIGSGLVVCWGLGFSAAELFQVFAVEMDWERLLDNDDGPYGLAMGVRNLITNFGFHSGHHMTKVFGDILEEKTGNRDLTIQEYDNRTGKTLTITGVCVDDHEVVYFNAENTPDMKVVDALRVSHSMPLAYAAVKIDGKHYVDGCTMTKSGAEIYDCPQGTPNPETILLSVRTEFHNPPTINTLDDYIHNLVHTVWETAHLYYDRDADARPIINVDVDMYSANFDIGPETKQALVNLGKEAAQAFVGGVYGKDGHAEIDRQELRALESSGGCCCVIC